VTIGEIRSKIKDKKTFFSVVKGIIRKKK